MQDVIQNLDDYLAVSQFGITLSSLGLGWIGEPAVAALIDPVLGQLLPAGAVHLVAFVLGFGFITFLHVVFGELAPKTFAIQEAQRIALLVAPLVKFFYYVFVSGIIVFNGTANYFTRLAGVSPASESEQTHTEEEIRMILTRFEGTGQRGRGDRERLRTRRRGRSRDHDPTPGCGDRPASTLLPDLRSVAAMGAYTRYLVLDEEGNQPFGFVHTKVFWSARV